MVLVEVGVNSVIIIVIVWVLGFFLLFFVGRVVFFGFKSILEVFVGIYLLGVFIGFLVIFWVENFYRFRYGLEF